MPRELACAPDALTCWLQGPGTARAALSRYSLSHRRYLGPTSMDSELAFVMTTLATIKRGDLVLDPFAGTGSVLVAAAARGAAVVGADIDVRVIRDGKADKSGVASGGVPHRTWLAGCPQCCTTTSHRHALHTGKPTQTAHSP